MDDFFTSEEKKELFSLYRHLMQSAGDSISWKDCIKLKNHLIKAAQCNGLQRNNFGMNPVIKDLQTAVIVAEEIGMKGSCLIGIMLHEIVKTHILSIDEVSVEYGEDVASIIKGLVKTNELYAKSPAIESENFRNLLLSFAEDMRVILIMIADRVNVMRQIKDTGNEEDRIKVANEAAYLFAPLAHKLGLYKLKSELEDLSLKYTQRDTYYFIKDKLNETKASRDKYIAAFIEPIKKKVTEAGLKFDIKGRTKSIHSIWNKIQKQKTPFEGIYDLFAIRIILDSEPDPAKEKQECWQVYSIVTDMYQPNPKRLRDWLSIPKSNGYESLHITVMGPEGKWVEVQIRTRRMDEIAERGLAAHWRYKGIKGETGLDEWLTSVREALENADNDSMKMMDQFKMDLYEDEVFVFTPKGDLFKLAKGATVLDFAFHIHSKLGCKCIGAKVNGKNVQLKQKLNSGDQVEIMTSNTQTPKQDWLKKRMAAGFCMELLAGESSVFFQKAYEWDWLDEALGSAFFCGEGYAFAAFSGSGTHPEETADFLGRELERLQREGFSQEDFQRIRKKHLGQLLRQLDTPQKLCFGQLAWARMDATAIDLLTCIKTMRQEEAEKMLKEDFSKENMVLSVVR